MTIPIDKTRKVKEYITYKNCNNNNKKCIFLKDNNNCSIGFKTKGILTSNEYLIISEDCDLVSVKFDNFHFTPKRIKFMFK